MNILCHFQIPQNANTLKANTNVVFTNCDLYYMSSVTTPFTFKSLLFKIVQFTKSTRYKFET